MRKLIIKRNNRKGFSLTELLVAVLILSMVSAVVAGGIPVARDAYEKITVTANAQVMLSTAISALRNELCTANVETPVPSEGTTKIRYYSPSIGNYSEIYVGKVPDEDNPGYDAYKGNTILIKQFANSSTGTKVRPLISKALGEDKLYVTYDTVSYENKNNTVTFGGLKVTDLKGKEYAKVSAPVKIRLIDGDKGLNTTTP